MPRSILLKKRKPVHQVTQQPDAPFEDAQCQTANDAGGFDQKLWLTQRDSNVRDSHAVLDGVTIPVNAKFKLSSGDELDYPGDPNGRLESIINCRCTVIFSKSSWS